ILVGSSERGSFIILRLILRSVFRVGDPSLGTSPPRVRWRRNENPKDNLRVGERLRSGFAGYVIVARRADDHQAGLGGVRPAIGMGPPAGGPVGGLTTIDQTGGPAPSGDQLTAIQYTGFLNFIPDVSTAVASFRLNGVAATGPANVFGALVIQNFTGGTYALY